MKRFTLPTLGTLLVLLGLWSCGSSSDKEQEQTTDHTNTVETPVANDLASVKARLQSIQNQLTQSNPETTGDVADQLALADEMGMLWKSPADGFPGFLNADVFTAYIPAVFQDASNAKDYHFQGSAQIGGEKKRWNGTISINKAPMLVEGTGKATHGIALGTFTIKENTGMPNAHQYEGTVQCMFSNNTEEGTVSRRSITDLPAGASAILFVGMRTPANGDTAEVALWGLGDEEDLSALLGQTESM